MLFSVIDESYFDFFIQVNFNSMTMSRPYNGAIRRLFEPALWINYTSSDSYHSLHCKMHHIQVREACLLDFIYLNLGSALLREMVEERFIVATCLGRLLDT